MLLLAVSGGLAAILVTMGLRRIAAEERLVENRFGRVREVVSGPDGYLYFSTSNRDGRNTPTLDDDRILRLVPAP